MPGSRPTARVAILVALLALIGPVRDRANAQVIPPNTPLPPNVTCDDLLNSEEGVLFGPTGTGLASPCTFPDKIPGDGIDSFDPNDKVAARGVGAAQFLTGEEPLRYAVYFENLATATAPAQEVFVTDQLDAASLDLTTFSLGPITFGDRTVVPSPGLTEFTTDVDLRPGQNLVVRITAELDLATALLRWTLLSIDPATGERPEDPLVGFLPPNVVPPAGQGGVLFTVQPAAGVPTGTTVCNQANIVFDLNAPILTSEPCNVFDASKPSSRVEPLAATQVSASFPVHWSGADEGAGVATYSVFVSEDGGPSMPFLVDTAETSATFTGVPGRSYAFFSIATDLVGHVEEAPPSPDATTTISDDLVPPITSVSLSASPNAAGWHNMDVTVTLTASDTEDGTGVREITYSAAGAQPIALTTAPGASVTLLVGTEGVTTLSFHATDNAGNIESLQILTINIDETPPVVSILSPADGAAYPLNGAVDADYGCADTLSGIGSCLGPVAAGLLIDTAVPGERSFTVVASDLAGNTAQQTASYSVEYVFSGFFRPLEDWPAINQGRAGRTYPVKWQLRDGTGAFISALSSVVSLLTAPAACDGSPGAMIEEKAAAAGATALRYDSAAEQFVYNWKTEAAWRGCRVLQLTLADGTRHLARFKF